MTKSNLLDYRKHGLDLRKTQAEIIKNKPNQGQPLVEALDEVSKNNQTYKPHSQALGEGIVTAAKAYFKGKDADKKIKVFETLETYAMEAQRQNDINEQKEAERVAIEPYATAALDLSYSDMAYEEANAKMRNIFNQAKQTNPELIKGEYIGFNPKTPFINYRDSEGNLQVFDASPFAGEEAVKRVQGNYLEQQKINLQSEANQISRDKNAIDLNNKGLENTQKAFGYIHENLAPPLEAANNTLRDGVKLLKIAEHHPEIFQSLAAINWNEQNPSYWTELQRKFDLSSTEQDRAIGVMLKGLNKMKVSGIKGVPGKGLNQWFEGVVAGSFPNMNMSYEAFKEAMMDELNNASAQKSKYSKLISEYDITPDKRLLKHFEGSANIHEPQNIKKFQGELPKGTVLMQTSDGIQIPVLSENIQGALADNLTFVSDYRSPSTGKVIKKTKPSAMQSYQRAD